MEKLKELIQFFVSADESDDGVSSARSLRTETGNETEDSEVVVASPHSRPHSQLGVTAVSRKL